MTLVQYIVEVFTAVVGTVIGLALGILALLSLNLIVSTIFSMFVKED